MVLAYVFLVCACLDPVMSNSDDNGYFWHLTDVHLDLNYINKSKCRLGSLGDYSCDSPLLLVKSAISAMQHFSVKKSVDFIVWSGDNGAHTNMTRDEVEESIRLVSGELRRHFPPERVYVLPAVGNHDVSPNNRMSPATGDAQRTQWCHRLASSPDLWGVWIKPHAGDNHPPVSNFSEGCFYSHLLSSGQSSSAWLLLVSLNGLIWYQENPLVDNTTVQDPLDQLQWLERTFQWARSTSTKVLVVSHFPPGASENTPGRFRFLVDSVNRRFLSLLRANADVIMAGLFAHEHVDTFRVLSGDESQPAVSMFIGPSITPLRMPGLGSFNPRIRLYRYRRSDHLLLDYEQYYLDLSAQTNPPAPNQHQQLWKWEYSSNREYNLVDLSPASLAGLLKSFENNDTGGADSVWSRYWSHELGHREHEAKPDGLCANPGDFLCRCEHLCVMRNLDLGELDTCLTGCRHPNAMTPATATLPSSSGPAPDRSNIPIIVGVIVAFLVILVGVVIVVNREICRKRGYSTRRLLGAHGPMGGILFSAIDPSLPISFTNSRGENDRGDRPLNGSVLTGNTVHFVGQPRSVFHPDMDDYSVVTVNTLDYNEKALSQHQLKAGHPEHNFTRSVGALERLPSLPNGAFLTPICRPGASGSAQQRPSYYSRSAYSSPNNLRHNAAPKLAVVLGSARASHPPQQPREEEQELEQGSMTTAGDNSSLTTNGRPSLQRTIPPEDYYADDEEAFTDDEDGGRPGEEDAKAGEEQLFSLVHAPTQLASSPDNQAVGVNGQFACWTPSSGRSSRSSRDSLSSADQQIAEGFLLDNDRVPLAKRSKDETTGGGSNNFIKRLSKTGFRLPPAFYTPQMILSRLSRSGDASNHYEGLGASESVAGDPVSGRDVQPHQAPDDDTNLPGLNHSQSLTFSAGQQEKQQQPPPASRHSRPASVASPGRSSAVMQARQQPVLNGHHHSGSTSELASCKPPPPAVLPVYSDEEVTKKKAITSAIETSLRGMTHIGYDYVRI